MKAFIWVLITLIIIVGLIMAIVSFFTGWHVETSSGNHTGYITAVEHNGLIWKKGRAYIKTETSSSQEESYCVMDEAVYNQLEQASKDKKQVTVHFKDYFIRGIVHCGEGDQAVIDSVK